jgi:hypothetical protein
LRQICVVPSASFNSYSKLSAGLDLAIANYNSQNLRLTFVRGSASDCGAILIPGTPSTAKVGGSVMNSCFRASENGELTASDKTALDYLY